MNPSSAGRLTRGVILLMAATTGVAVANLYYVQPLLDVIAGDLGVSASTAGLLVTMTQLGYVPGSSSWSRSATWSSAAG